MSSSKNTNAPLVSRTADKHGEGVSHFRNEAYQRHDHFSIAHVQQPKPNVAKVNRRRVVSSSQSLKQRGPTQQYFNNNAAGGAAGYKRQNISRPVGHLNPLSATDFAANETNDLGRLGAAAGAEDSFFDGQDSGIAAVNRTTLDGDRRADSMIIEGHDVAALNQSDNGATFDIQQ